MTDNRNLIVRLPAEEWTRLADHFDYEIADEFDADVRLIEHPRVAELISALDLAIEHAITNAAQRVLSKRPNLDEVLAAIQECEAGKIDDFYAGRGAAYDAVRRLFAERAGS